MNMIEKKGAFVLALAGASLGMTSCGGVNQSVPINVNVQPAYLGTITAASYDGNTDDLLTAGLGAAGLAAATAPAYADPNHPTAAELRRNAIYNNYRAVLDISANSGYGTLYGPNVDASGNVTSGTGKIAGTESIAYSDDGSGTQNVTLMVQVPDSFDPANACIVTGTSSGSRGMRHRQQRRVGLEEPLRGGLCGQGQRHRPVHVRRRRQREPAKRRPGHPCRSRQERHLRAGFEPGLSDDARAQFALSSPKRVAFKHAHSQQNPEQDWGKFTLQAV